MNNKIFYTVNPHINNFSMKKLLSSYNYILKRYYKKKFGVRYNKYKNQQYEIFIFPEKTFNEISEPHLHILLDIPQEDMESFFIFMYGELKLLYPSLTADIQIIPTEKDFENVVRYCLKEQGNIYGKQALFDNDF